MNDERAKSVNPLVAIRQMQIDVEAEFSWLGENYRGWQGFANSLKILSEDYECKIESQPEQGFLRVDCAFAPPHIQKLGYAVELATSLVCQRCGDSPAVEEIIDDWKWKLSHRCINKNGR
ncbi:hypothetical protein ACIOUF_15865 [Pseudomonas iridis]|uniref:Uncharacterized protein n=1 Tax=Pseudomonas iridis TaxID=2710587 RepID=A0ABW8DP45_9PSED